jgi:hypothetical protein
MARRIVHQLVDDLDGSVLEVGEGETVLFSLDGTAYEIDLSGDNAKAFRDALAPYLDAARSVSSSRSSGSNGAGRPRRRAEQTRDYTDIRAWAKANGHEVSDRGRVPATVLDAYEAAH